MSTADSPTPQAQLTQEEHLRLLALLDDCIELRGEARASWLQELESREPVLAPVLRRLLAAQEHCEAEDFLGTLGPLPASPAEETADTALVGHVLGPYRILKLLGRGGMGSVWLAERTDGLFKRQVALKLIHPALISAAVAERFAREREILAALNHPNIAPLLDAGFAADGQPWLALEYIAGVSLQQYCDSGRLGIEARLRLFREVLAAVEFAHAHLVIHRDLKPSNILISSDGHPHLLDFGIAKLLNDGGAAQTELTRMAAPGLTPEYAAPEQIAGTAVTTATDVYSLGVMLYELLCGQRPYRVTRTTRGALEDAILQTEPLPPSRAMLTADDAAARAATPARLVRTLRGDLDTIVGKALSKQPAERYATANAFSEDIGRFLRGEPVLAQRDRIGYRAWKFVRRYRIALAVGALLLLTLTGGLVAATYEARVAARQRDSALEAQSRALTQAAASRLKDGEASAALAIILEVLERQRAQNTYTPEALSVFQEARAADLLVLAVTGHEDRVRSVAFSPDGSRIATASYDHTARIWDSSTGRELLRLTGHTDRVRDARFSPDGRRLVTGSLDGSARIWDATSGAQLLQLGGGSGRVRSVSFSPDGSRIVTAHSDNAARIWDATTGALLHTLTGHEGAVSAAAWSPDGQRIVTGSNDNTARLWEAASGRELLRFDKHTASINWVTFSPDGSRVLSAAADKTARLWDARSGEQFMLFSGHTQQLESAHFSADGQQIITASDDKSARVWDTLSGRQLLQLSGHAEQVIDAAFSPDGNRFATASDDHTVRIWNARMPEERMQLRGHTQLLAGADYSHDGRYVATASADKTVRIWDAASGRQVQQLNGHRELVLSAEFSPDGRRIVTASNDGTARVWDPLSGRSLLQLNGHTQPVEAAIYSPDGKRIATSSYDKSIRLWDAASGQQLTQLAGHGAGVNWVSWSPDGRRIVSASFDQTARVWDAADGHQLFVLKGHSGTVATAAFSPDGSHIVTASDDHTARLWDAATGSQQSILSGHADRVTSASFAANGRLIVTSSLDRTARIWDARTGRELLAARHTDLVETAAFAPDSSHIVTAADDRAAHIWDIHPAPLEAQISWAQAALFDSLPAAERFQLGMSEPQHQWPGSRTACDDAAASPYDPGRHAAGAAVAQIVPDVAVSACEADLQASSATADKARARYQLGRAHWAAGQHQQARGDFEQALQLGYPFAAVDLAELLSTQPAAPELRRALSLNQQAWKAKFTRAAYELGVLYEEYPELAGTTAAALTPARSPVGQQGAVRTDALAEALSWYQRAADAGDPAALAALAKRTEPQAQEGSSQQEEASLLQAMRLYAMATSAAARESLPDEIWRDWRYRRAWLARLLARRGQLERVAAIHDETCCRKQQHQ
jgi:eukaryotic-like serine/threonine-protein kinase